MTASLPRLALTLALALAGSVLPARAAGAPVVDEVALRAPPGEDLARLRALVSVRPGEELSIRELRRTVVALFALGRFSDVVARTEPRAPGHALLVLECLPRRLVASVRLVRPPGAPLPDDRVRRALALAPGDELWNGRLEAAVERVRAACARAGYRAASVRARAEGTTEAAVVVEVDEGLPTRVGSLRFAPAPGLAPAALAEGLASRPGAVLDLDALGEDVRALRARLRREGFLRARVGTPSVAVNGGLASVDIPIDAGPKIEVRFAGEESFTAADLRPALGLETEAALDAPALDAAAGRVRAFYVARGFATAEVRATEWSGGGRVAFVFTVREGRRYRVREVTFPGATRRPPAWLRARLEETLAALPAPDLPAMRADAERLARASGLPATVRSPAQVEPQHVWDPPAWDAATLAVVELYRADGYLDAAYEGTRATLDARAGTCDLAIRLREGVRTMVERVEIEGSAAVRPERLRGEARIAAGEPLSYGAVEATRAAFLALYARSGHLYARVTDEETFSPDRSRATVRFRTEEGPEVRVRSVSITGAPRTQENVIREAVGIGPGDVYDPEAAARGQAALLRLGIFRSVGLRLSDADVAEGSKDLLVELTERPWRTLAPGFGFSLANGPRAFIELVEPNLGGRALELAARAKVNYPLGTFRPDLATRPPAERVEGRADVGLHHPRVHLLGLAFGARVDGIVERLHRRAYDLSRGSTVVGADLPLASRITLSLQYELEVDHIVKSDAAASVALTRADVERLRFPEGVTTLQSFRPVLALDFRDSSVQPRRGWLATGTADYARSIGTASDRLLFGLVHGSDVFTHMLKLSGTLSGYLPAGASVVAVSLRGGRVLPLDPASQTIGPKRFFLGGAATMRGYGEDEMIPQDVRAAYVEGVRACASSLSGAGCSTAARQLAAGQGLTSEGGESFLLAKAELRVPLRESVEAGLFADVGNLWLDPRAATVTNLRLSVGAGLRFVTPVGPAVLDVGIDTTPDARLGESVWAPHFSIGVF